MNESNTEFEFYVDKRANSDNYFRLCEHPVYSIDYIEKILLETNVGIVVTTQKYADVFMDIYYRFNTFKNSINLLIPVWKNEDGNYKYVINRLLGVFRRKLLGWKKEDIPTMISNDCTAGRFYECLGVYGDISETPTVNVFIKTNDFIKICVDPKLYLCSEISDGGMTSSIIDNFMPYPTGKVSDVSIQFVHTKKNYDVVAERWNKRKGNIKWDNVVFLLREGENNPIQMKHFYEMRKCKYPYFILKRNDDFPKIEDTFVREGRYLYVPRITSIFDNEEAIENAFDFVAWLKGL